MNMETASETLVENAKKVGKGAKAAAAKATTAAKADRSWIEKAHAEAAAHNARPSMRGMELFSTDIHETVGEASAEVKKDIRRTPVQFAIGACLILMWGTLGAMIVGLFLR